MSRRQNFTQRRKRNGTRKVNKRINVPHSVGMMQPRVTPFTSNVRFVKKAFKFVVPNVTTDATGNLLHRISLRNLQRAFDGTGTYTDAASAAQLYDCYKPIQLRIRTIPCFALSVFAVSSFVIATDYDDNDTSQVVNTLQDAYAYEHSLPYDPRSTNVAVIPIPVLSSGTIPGIATTSPVTIQAGGFLDFNAPPYDGVVYLVGGNNPANFPLFDLYLEMDVLLRFAR